MHHITTVGVHEVAWRLVFRTWQGTVQDLSTVPVKVAFVAPGTTPPDDPDNVVWHAGAWSAPGYLTILVGDTITLAAGSYAEWVWPQDSPLKPGMMVGTLNVA